MTDLSASITHLSTQIQEDAKAIETYLKSNSLPQLSLAEDAFPFFPGTGPAAIDSFPPPPENIQTARNNLRQSCELLLQLVSSPSEYLARNIATAHLCSSTCLQYVYHFSIAEAVPPNGHINFKDLASKVNVAESQCTRILRMLMTQNVFIEKTPGNVSHTAMSKLLMNPRMRDTIGYLLEEGFVGAPHLTEAAERFEGSEERHHAPWNVGHQTDLPVFEFFETNPARMRRFLGNMENLGNQDTYNIQYIVRSYDWSSLDPGTVVDIGGSVGHVSIEISKIAPQLDFVVQDLEQVVTDMRRRTQEHPYARVRWERHDFFEPQPIRNARVYLLRFILHDYSDKYAARILNAIVPAMDESSRILVFDGIMPDPNTLTKPGERKAR